MKYKLRFKGNLIELLDGNNPVLKCLSTGFLLHFKFSIRDNNDELLLTYKYFTLFGYEKVKILDQKTENDIVLIKDHPEFYRIEVQNRIYAIKETKGFFKKRIANIFVNNIEIGYVNYEYLKSPWVLNIIFTNKSEIDIYVLILLIIKYSHFDAEAA